MVILLRKSTVSDKLSNISKKMIGFLAFATFAAAISAVYLVKPAPQPAASLGPSASSGAAAIGGQFSLIDQYGRPVTEARLLGHISLIYFGYTFCPDVCPTTLAAISEGLNQFEAKYAERGKRVEPVFITVDPERDTPSVMATYAKNFHPRLLALSGAPVDVAKAMRAYKVYAEKRIEGGDTKNYLVDHASTVYIMDMKGHYLANISGAVTPAQVVAALAKAMP